MSTADATHVRTPAGRAAKAQTAKEKRQRLLLAGGAVLFIALLAVQVPRTLRMLSPAETAVAPVEAPPIAVPVPAEAAPAPPATSPEYAARVEALQSQYLAKDPFARRSVAAAATAVSVRPAPAGRRDPFAAKTSGVASPLPGIVSGAGVRDPFAPSDVRAVPAPPPVAPDPAPAPAPGVRLRGYTIVLVSVPVRAGRPAAAQAAAAARARGVPGVGVLRSSDYATLNPGYFAVYSRVFETRTQAQRAVGQARVLGYPKAYVRPLGR